MFRGFDNNTLAGGRSGLPFSLFLKYIAQCSIE
jgi:hypothetical protein